MFFSSFFSPPLPPRLYPQYGCPLRLPIYACSNVSGLALASVDLFPNSLLMRIDDRDVPRHELLKLPYLDPKRQPLFDRNEW